MNDILITGAAGFIGSHVAEAFLRNGDRVAVVDNLDPFYPATWKRRNLADVMKSGKAEFFECDIRDQAELDQAFARFRPSIVIHLAARAGVRPSIEQPRLYEEVNVGGTYGILECCRRHGVKSLVLGSSSSVYGNASPKPFREDTCCLRPVSPYAASKISAEAIAYTYSHLFGLNVACLRFFTVYGPRQRPDLAIHKFTALIEKGKELPIFGDGGSGRDYTFVDDIVAGVCAAARLCTSHAGEGMYEIFNLGNSSPVMLAELVAALEEATGKRAIRKSLPAQPGDVSGTWADISKAAAALGFEPKTKLKDGLARFVDWYRAQPEDFRA